MENASNFITNNSVDQNIAEFSKFINNLMLIYGNFQGVLIQNQYPKLA